MDSTQLQIIITAIDEASASLAKISDSLKDVGAVADEVNGQLADGSKAAATSMEGVTTAAGGESAALERLQTLMVQQASIARAQLDATEAQTAAMEKQAGTADAQGAGYSKIALGAGAMAVGVGYAIDKTVTSYADLQSAVTRLVTSAGESSKNLTMVTQGIMTTARATGTSTTDLANGMYYIESAGYHGAAGLKVMQAAAEGAKDENANFTTVADAVTTVMNDYGKSIKSPTEAMNAMITAVSHGKTTLQLFSSSLATVLPTAQTAGLSFQQVAGAIATMTSEGSTAQRATQNLRSAIQGLSGPSNTQMDIWQQMGLNVTDITTKLGSRGLTGTLQVLVDAVNKQTSAGITNLGVMMNSKSAQEDVTKALSLMPPALQSVAKEYTNGSITANQWRLDLYNMTGTQRDLGTQFNTLLGKARGYNSEIKAGQPTQLAYEAALKKVVGTQAGMQVALMLTGTHSKTAAKNVNDVAKAMSNASGKVEGWADMQGTFNQRMSELKEDFATTGMEIGKAFIPVLTVAAKALALFFAPLAIIITKFPILGAVILAAAGAFAAFILIMIGISKVNKYIGEATEEFGKLAKAMKLDAAITKVMTGVQAAFNAVMDLNPVILIAAGVIALAAAMVFLYTRVKPVHDVMVAFAKAMGLGALKGPVDFIRGEMDKAFHDLGKAVQEPGKAFAILRSDFSKLTSDTKNELEKWAKDLDKIWKSIHVPIEAAAALLLLAFGPALAITGAQAAVAGTKIAIDFAGKALSAIRGLGGQGMSMIKTFGNNIVDLGKSAVGAGKQLVSSLVSSAQQVWSALVKAAVGLWGAATAAYSYAAAGWAAAVAWAAANIPIIVTVAIIVAVIAVIVLLITHWKDVKKYGMDAWNGIKTAWDAATGFFSRLWDDVENFFKEHWKIMLAVVLAPIAPIIAAWLIFPKFFSGLWAGIKSAINAFTGFVVQFWQNEWNGLVRIWNAVTGFFTNTWNGIKMAIAIFKGFIVRFFQDEWNGFANIFNGIGKFFGGVWNDIKTSIGNADQLLYDVGHNIIEGLKNGITDAGKDAVNAVKNVGSNIESGLKSLLGIHSPSTVFAEIGQNVDKGLQQGITGNKSQVTDAATDLGNATVKNARQAVTSAGSAPMQAVNPATGQAMGGGGGFGNVTIEINNGIFMMNQAQATQLATQIYQSLQAIARQHGLQGNLPSIGVRPV